MDIAERSKTLPLGGNVPAEQKQQLVQRLQAAMEYARSCQEVLFEPMASELWERMYASLSTETPGRLDFVTSRAEPQVRRLAMIYALLDSSSVICVEHLDAAHALWQYAFRSAQYLFGSSTGNADADRILSAIRQSGSTGMTQTQISHLLNNPKQNRLRMAMETLLRHELVVQEERRGQGRPTRIYFAR